jgi:hypothetical protein
MTGADSIRLVHPLFQGEGGGSTPTSALQLRVMRVTHYVARQLNRLWHSRLPRVGAGSRACYAAEHDGVFYAVAIWARPVARLLPQWEWLELQRLAIAPDAPRNTASRMLAVMTRLVRRDFPDVVRLISYQDTEVHSGTIYRAAGWTPTAASVGGEWDRPSRRGNKAQSAAPKLRWERELAS